MNSHLPFKNEYLGFLAHLRGLAGNSPDIPGITSLLTLPFLARLTVEDFVSTALFPHHLTISLISCADFTLRYREPTLRLDLAPPSLNWLTRRSVLAAVHSNTPLIEQIHVATLFLEGSSSSYSYAGFDSGMSLAFYPW
jgi:Rab guanine nucleotide exchange factor SEC2